MLSEAEKAVSIAYHSAANCVALFDAYAHNMNWPGFGEPEIPPSLEDRADLQEWLAGFVRLNPHAPPEALYRWAHGQGIHDRAVDGYHGTSDTSDVQADDAVEAPYRMAYLVFATVLKAVDKALAEERARAAEAVQAAAGPVLAAALFERPEDTILELQPDPLATNPNLSLGPIVSASSK